MRIAMVGMGISSNAAARTDDHDRALRVDDDGTREWRTDASDHLWGAQRLPAISALTSLQCSWQRLKGTQLMLRQVAPANTRLASGTGNDYTFVALSTRAKD